MYNGIKVAHIVAYNHARVIGNDNKLLWRLPGDLQRFKKLTTGHPVIMGRKTFESIGRPLPQRYNIVVTRQNPPPPNTEHVYYASNVDHALSVATQQAKWHGLDRVYIIGGGMLYEETLDLADVLEITRVENHFKGDAYYPGFDTSRYNLTSIEPDQCDEGSEWHYSYYTYERRAELNAN